jgi:hypothetical protein
MYSGLKTTFYRSFSNGTLLIVASPSVAAELSEQRSVSGQHQSRCQPRFVRHCPA